MRLFITGGTGFLGRPLCAAVGGHELLVLSRNPSHPHLPRYCQVLQGDLLQPASWKNQLAAFRPEACLHLAWSGLPDYSLNTCAKNFQAGVDLFQHLVEIHCPRVVVTGTCFEYGNLTGCVTEGRVPSVQAVFAAFKTAQRLVGESLFAPTGTTFVWARPFFVYGPGQRPTSLIPSAYRSLRSGQRPTLRTPEAVQDFVHVEDVASGLAVLATYKCPAGVYNLGSGRPTRVADLVDWMARMLERESEPGGAWRPLRSHAEPGNQVGQGFWASTEKMIKHTGWTPHRTLEDGLEQTMASWREEP